jgi:hypothetical protein
MIYSLYNVYPNLFLILIGHFSTAKNYFQGDEFGLIVTHSVLSNISITKKCLSVYQYIFKLSRYNSYYVTPTLTLDKSALKHHIVNFLYIANNVTIH